jgi:prepilin-type N-terminal cleavage/methylation domain-containing protein
MRFKNKWQGFNLAELLIALAILALISAFTIPKILIAQQNERYKATAKEDIAAVSAALQLLKAQGSSSAATKWADITPYMNYVSIDTSGSLIDAVPGQTTYTCGSSRPCMRMHNGSTVNYRTAISFGGTNYINAMHLHIDPDSQVTDGTTNGPGKSVAIFFYYDGKVMDEGNIVTNTTNNSTTYAATPANVPDWFSW